MPRLSRAQLQNTLQFALALALPNDAASIWAAVKPTFARYPADVITPAPGDLRGGYGRADQAIQQTQVDAMFDTAVAIGAQLTSTTARMTALLGACATDASTTNDRACLEAFVQRFGARVTRAPLKPAEVTTYANISDPTPVAPAAVADVIVTLLSAPQTLYRVEHGTLDSAATAPLSAYELAARLSYQYWQSPPDDALWAAAADGSLLTAAGFDAQLDRLVNDARLSASLDEFASQWLRLTELPPLDALSADPTFKAFAGSTLPAASSRDAMVNDVLASLTATVRGGGNASDFLTDRRAFATDDFVAGVYGVAKWSGTGAAPLPASSKRAGLLTRAAMLSTGTAMTRPIHKGYLVRNAILCQQVGAPPQNVDLTPPMSTGSMTTRQAVEAKTGSGVCAGCHPTRINPPGFLTEGFDALGRERTAEQLFDATGHVTGTLPIDSSAAPVLTPGDTRKMADAVELTQAIDATRLYQSCLARQYFRFSAIRYESSSRDGCALAAMETAARAGKPLTEVLEAYARTASFKQRRFQ
ncbi:MAG: DUF1592 domain-containing protein [Archangiaceae bacterium]|nr:DUF1592 domain-containing protein [Archangiaceae bacterium]